MTLFRPEALQYQQGSWLGAIQLTQPPALRWITLGAVLSVAAVLAFLVWGEASRSSHLVGVLMPEQGVVRVGAPRVAAVQRVLVAEGQAVQAGELLMTLEWLEPQLNTVAQTQVQQALDARLRSLAQSTERDTQLSQEQARSLAQRISSLERELVQADEQQRWQAQRLALAEQTMARWAALEKDQFISPAQLQAQGEAVMSLRAEQAALARQRQALASELAERQSDQRALPLQSAQRQGELARQHQEVAQANTLASGEATRRVWRILAPVAGRVGALHVNAGQSVPEGLALVSLLPAGAGMQAQLYAPSSALGFIAVGQLVQLRLQAYPYQQFGALAGKVSQVALAPVPPAELASVVPLAQRPPESAAEPLYRVTVTLPQQTLWAAGAERPLLAGMQLEADVLLERRRLIEWLFEPLLGWRQRM